MLGALIVYHVVYRLFGVCWGERITPARIREHKFRRVGEFALLMQVRGRAASALASAVPLTEPTRAHYPYQIFYLTLATKVRGKAPGRSYG